MVSDYIKSTAELVVGSTGEIMPKAFFLLCRPYLKLWQINWTENLREMPVVL